MFSLESPHRGDSNENIQHTVFTIQKKEISPLIIQNLPLWEFSEGLKNEFETAVVDEPSVFEPLKFYCIVLFDIKCIQIEPLQDFRGGVGQR